mmetsp:Transcript_24474/g.41040  ORF Transcript_24474/g.41040 Transcript_24474/m.41040 type:complete len:103 (+) Transcript_24474:751-1059(+)
MLAASETGDHTTPTGWEPVERSIHQTRGWSSPLGLADNFSAFGDGSGLSSDALSDRGPLRRLSLWAVAVDVDGVLRAGGQYGASTSSHPSSSPPLMRRFNRL